MGLFDVEVTDSSLGWDNIKAAKSSTEAWMKAELEKLWTYYEPARSGRRRGSKPMREAAFAQ